MRANDRLYNQIKGGIYHSTSLAGYRGIRASGAILPNDGSLPFSHGQSPHSCCHRVGAIALLDLRSPSRPLVGRDGWFNWTTFLTNHKPITLLLDLDPDSLTEPLHDYESMQARFPYATMVAEAEKCYAGRIPFEAIRRCVLICAKHRSFFRVIARGAIEDAEFDRIQRSFDSRLQKIGWKEPWLDFSMIRVSQ